MEDPGRTDEQHQSQQRLHTFRSNSSAMISSFHYQVNRLSDLLDESMSPDIVTTASFQDRQALEFRQCCRNIQGIFSRQEELEFLLNGLFHGISEGNGDGSSNGHISEHPDTEHDPLRRREELCMFMDDLVKLACLENCWNDPSDAASAENPLHSLIMTTLLFVLPSAANVCPLNRDQISALLKRVLFLVQDITDGNSNLNAPINPASRGGSQDDLELLEHLITLMNDRVTIEQLQQIIDPSEAAQVLKIPLELMCLSSRQKTNLESPGLSLPSSLLCPLRVFVDCLLQNLNETIGQEYQRGSHSPTVLRPSVREWLSQQEPCGNKTRAASATQTKQDIDEDFQDSEPQMTAYGLQSYRGIGAVITPADAEEYEFSSSQGSTAEETLDALQLLSLLDRYGSCLLEETMKLLQGCPASASQCPSEQPDGDSDHDMGDNDEEICMAEDKRRSVKNRQELGRKQIASVMRTARMSTNFLLFMDSEETIADDPKASGALCSLWTAMANFILDKMSEAEYDEELDELQRNATEIFFRLTKSHVGALVSSDAGGKSREDEITKLATVIFRLMSGPDGGTWNEEAKEWVAFLLEKYSDRISLQRLLYSALLSLQLCPEEDEMDRGEDNESTYFSLLGLTGLDSCDETNCADDEESEEDPWRSYVRDICFPGSRATQVGAEINDQ